MKWNVASTEKERERECVYVCERESGPVFL